MRSHSPEHRDGRDDEWLDPQRREPEITTWPARNLISYVPSLSVECQAAAVSVLLSLLGLGILAFRVCKSVTSIDLGLPARMGTVLNQAMVEAVVRLGGMKWKSTASPHVPKGWREKCFLLL